LTVTGVYIALFPLLTARFSKVAKKAME